MNYADILNKAIYDSGFSLSQISKKLELLEVRANRGYLSKLKNGNTSPASDKMNHALAEVLKIDPIELQTAAYREKIPPEVLERLRTPSNAN
jgi:transcriptional regulator with XRE-family HTH domain